MKIGFDTTPAAPAGTYSQHLAKLLARYNPEHEYVVEGKRYNEVDLYHCCRTVLPLLVRLRSIPFVMTVHNLNFLRYPHLYSFPERLVLLRLYRRALRDASRLITVNRDAREELSERLRIDPRKIEVMMPLSVGIPQEPPVQAELEVVRRKYMLPKDFILIIGTVEPRHNHEIVLEALLALRNQVRERRGGEDSVGEYTAGEDSVGKYPAGEGFADESPAGERLAPNGRGDRNAPEPDNGGFRPTRQIRAAEAGFAGTGSVDADANDAVPGRGLTTAQAGTSDPVRSGGRMMEQAGTSDAVKDGGCVTAQAGASDVATGGGRVTEQAGVGQADGRTACEERVVQTGIVICGRRTTYSDFLLGYARARHMAAHLDFIYELTPDDLPALFRMARAFVYLPDADCEASIVPVVEALRARLPMVLSDTRLNREAAGEAAVYVRPEAVGEVAAALENVLCDENFRREMQAREHRRAELFSEYAVARRLIDIYNSL